MPGIPWTTEEQGKWFDDRKGSFALAQKASKVKEYLTEAQSEFFERWPEVEAMFGVGAVVSSLNKEQMEQYTQALKRRKSMRTLSFAQ